MPDLINHERQVGSFEVEEAESGAEDRDVGSPRLPNELVARIMKDLHRSQQLATLARVATACRAFESMAVPLLYETILVTERNMGTVPRGPTYEEYFVSGIDRTRLIRRPHRAEDRALTTIRGRLRQLQSHSSCENREHCLTVEESYSIQTNQSENLPFTTSFKV
jgi:hypothetical protein